MGACRRDELYKIKITDVEDVGTAVLVKVPTTKTKVCRKFTITGHFSEIVKKYIKLRPPNQSTFFLNYQKGKCTLQKVGINKFGNLGKQIATYLKLPHPELYTGHCFRRSSATILVDSGEDITSLKRHGGWKSTRVAEGYIEDSMANKNHVANKILNSIEKNINISSVASTSRSENVQNTEHVSIENDETNTSKIIIQNCSNFTLVFNEK